MAHDCVSVFLSIEVYMLNQKEACLFVKFCQLLLALFSSCPSVSFH